MIARAPFDPADPFDRTAEHMRQAVADAILPMVGTTGLPDHKELQSITVGTLCALAGYFQASLCDEHHADIGDMIRDMVDFAVRAAAEIVEAGIEGTVQ